MISSVQSHSLHGYKHTGRQNPRARLEGRYEIVRYRGVTFVLAGTYEGGRLIAVSPVQSQRTEVVMVVIMVVVVLV